MDKHDKLERAQEEILRIDAAIGELKEVRDMGPVIDILKDRMLTLHFERDEYQKLIEAEDAREEAEQIRDYWRMVL